MERSAAGTRGPTWAGGWPSHTACDTEPLGAAGPSRERCTALPGLRQHRSEELGRPVPLCCEGQRGVYLRGRRLCGSSPAPSPNSQPISSSATKRETKPLLSPCVLTS